MAAVIRLKRRIDEDPLNAFVLNCKRQRTGFDGAQQNVETNGNANLEETSTVLKFAGTFEKADSISTHLQQRLSKEEAKEVISRVRRPAILSKNRAASRLNAQNSRFRIVNCTRSLLGNGETDGEAHVAPTTIVDVERDISNDGPDSNQLPRSAQETSHSSSSRHPAPEASAAGYVYDLYVADENHQPQHIPYIPDNLDDISVAIYEDPLYCSHRGLGDRSDESAGDESEDSNDENNWRNDYPDEEDENSIDEDDMRRAVAEVDLDYASSDTDISAYSNEVPKHYHRSVNAVNSSPDMSDDDTESGYDLDPTDVQQFGTAYARYKARIGAAKQRVKHLRKHRSHAESDSDSDSDISFSASSEDLDLYD